MERREYLVSGGAMGMSLLVGCLGGAGIIGGGGIKVQETSHVEWTGSFEFTPQYIHVDRDTTVTWKNNESYSHTVIAVSNNWQKDTKVPPGETTTHTFERDGVYTAGCGVHGARMRIGVGDAKIKTPIES